MKTGLILAGIAFAVTAAIVVGSRLSDEAMAVVVGAVCGISASVPVSLALVIAASRNWGRGESPREIGYDYESRRYAPQPPPQILVVSPPQHPMAYPSPYYLPPGAPAQGAPRDFKIVGDE